MLETFQGKGLCLLRSLWISPDCCVVHGYLQNTYECLALIFKIFYYDDFFLLFFNFAIVIPQHQVRKDEGKQCKLDVD